MTQGRNDIASALHHLVVFGPGSIDGGDHGCQPMTETPQPHRTAVVAGIPVDGRGALTPAPMTLETAPEKGLVDLDDAVQQSQTDVSQSFGKPMPPAKHRRRRHRQFRPCREGPNRAEILAQKMGVGTPLLGMTQSRKRCAREGIETEAAATGGRRCTAKPLAAQRVSSMTSGTVTIAAGTETLAVHLPGSRFEHESSDVLETTWSSQSLDLQSLCGSQLPTKGSRETLKLPRFHDGITPDEMPLS